VALFLLKLEWQLSLWFRHTSHDTSTVIIWSKKKKTVKPISVLDYNQCMGGVALKTSCCTHYFTERKRMNKWYMELFCRLLNTSILNALKRYRNNMAKRANQLSFRIQLVEWLFPKYAVCDRTQSARLTFFWQQSATSDGQTFSKQDSAFWEETKTTETMCLSEVQEDEGNYVLVWHVTLDSVWNVFETTTPSSISKVIKHYSFIILQKFTVLKVILKCSSVNIQIPCTSLDTMLKSEWRKKFFLPHLLLLKWCAAFSSVNASMSSIPRTE
jgi:hypothetical protein